MSFLYWFLGGINFKQTRYGKIGDIIPPAYNGTNGWFKTSRWDMVTKIDKKGYIIGRSIIWDYATVRALELIELKQKLSEKEK